MNQSTEPLSPYQLWQLHAPGIDGDRVAQRRGGSGKMLSYVEAWEIKSLLITVFGYAGFSAECVSTQVLREGRQKTSNDSEVWAITATATMRLTIHQTGAVYTEAAAGTALSSDYGEATDNAIKNAQSDALKRCAIYLGTQFGLSLYDDGSHRNVVRDPVAPEQRDLIRDVNTARTESVPAEERQAAGKRLSAAASWQARFKLHSTDLTIEADPDPDPDTEPEQQPVDPAQVAREMTERAQAHVEQIAKRRAQSGSARQKRAKDALAAAEAATGVQPVQTVTSPQEGQ